MGDLVSKIEVENDRRQSSFSATHKYMFHMHMYIHSGTYMHYSYTVHMQICKYKQITVFKYHSELDNMVYWRFTGSLG